MVGCGTVKIVSAPALFGLESLRIEAGPGCKNKSLIYWIVNKVFFYTYVTKALENLIYIMFLSFIKTSAPFPFPGCISIEYHQ